SDTINVFARLGYMLEACSLAVVKAMLDIFRTLFLAPRRSSHERPQGSVSTLSPGRKNESQRTDLPLVYRHTADLHRLLLAPARNQKIFAGFPERRLDRAPNRRHS